MRWFKIKGTNSPFIIPRRFPVYVHILVYRKQEGSEYKFSISKLNKTKAKHIEKLSKLELNFYFTLLLVFKKKLCFLLLKAPDYKLASLPLKSFCLGVFNFKSK